VALPALRLTPVEPLTVLIPLSPEILLRAYAAGIFPMAESADDPELFWVDPKRRGIIPLDGFHVPRRLRRIVRQNLELYTGLFERGAAHSVECWREGELVGGLYGVSLGGAFFGESMFSRVTDASKVALVHLVARLRHGGYRVLDTQFLTPHLAQFGAIEISRARYHRLLGEALRYRGVFPRDLPAGAGVLGAAAGVEGAPPGPLQARRLTS